MSTLRNQIAFIMALLPTLAVCQQQTEAGFQIIGKEITASLYAGLSDEMRSSHYGRVVYEFISLNKGVKVGDKYIDFAQPGIDGKLVRLSDFDGKVVLLEFWGSWCGPCRKSNPGLVKVYNEFKNQGFEILGVGAEKDREIWISAIQTDNLTWTNVTDLKGNRNQAAQIYGVSYYPTNFLIDQTGTIVSKDLRGAELRRTLKQILKK